MERLNAIEYNKNEPDATKHKPTHITSIINNGVIEPPAKTKMINTSLESGKPVVYVGITEDGRNPKQRDIFELMKRQRPYICRAAYNPSVGGMGQKRKDKGTLDCFSMSGELGQSLFQITKNNRTNMRELAKFAKEAENTLDRKEWAPWEKALLGELLKQRERLEVTILQDEDSAGHKFPDGSIARMIIDDCHAIIR